MHTDPNQFKNRVQVTLSESQVEMQYKKVLEFQNEFAKMQSEFKHSEDKVYYLVSVKFISEWRQFCHSTESTRLQPHPMNQDLYENGELKRGLSEGADFQLVNQKIYQLFQPFSDQTGQNKREAIFLGDEKRVPIYLSTFSYIVTSLQMLKDIDFKRRSAESLKLQTIKTSESSTLSHFMNLIREKENFSERINLRLWLPQKQLTLVKLHQLIIKQLKPLNVPSYKIQGVGKRLDNLQAKIQQVFGVDNTYFIVESKMQEERFVLMKDNEGRCESCNHFGILQFPCGCNEVKYCSEKCLQKDRMYHGKTCAWVQEMQLNKKVDMTLLPNARKGLVGLNNLGNTCFMNSCLQCLSHTMPLTNYFLRQYFQAQINKTNKIGFKGKLAKNYAKFIKGMWCEQDDTFAPYSIKKAVSDINPMFSGYAQHDSQQFFSFLADGLHEDLNRIQTKPYVPSVEQENKQQVQLARESWIAHLKRNQSIVTDLMTGQYRSIVTCPDCHHRSTTFDPFTTVSLTIPQSSQNVTNFFMIHANMEKKTKQGWFKYNKNDPVEWNRRACQAVGGDPARCCLYVVTMKQNLYKVGRQSMAQIAHKIQNEQKNMFLIQLTNQQMNIPKQNFVEFTLRFSKAAYYRNEELFFKIPIYFDKQNLNGLIVYKRILKLLYAECYKNSSKKSLLSWGSGSKSYDEYEKEMLQYRPFKCILRIEKKLQRSYGRTEVDFQKQIELQDQTSIMEIIQSKEIKTIQCEIDARFDRNKMDDFNFQKLKDFETIGKQPKVDKQTSEMELQRCLQSFSSPQILQAGNEWYCPKCKEHKLAKKQLSIYRSPKILILHLKRFKQKGTFKKEKNQTLIHFPGELNLQPYLIDSRPIQAYKEEIQDQIYIPSKAPELPFIMSNTKSKPIYQLYAISNHYGGLGGGHYTAYAKNNGQWYQFDDSRVSSNIRKDIVSSSAYILFYQRKD